MKRHDTIISGRGVRYYEAGDGPPVLLLHGMGGSGKLWRPQLNALSGRFRMIAPDMPGFGASEYDPGIRAVRDYSGFAARFMAEMGLDSAAVCGISMGGWVACWLAVRQPEMVERLALVAPAGLSDHHEPPWDTRQVKEGLEGLYHGYPEKELGHALATIDTLERAGGLEPDLKPVLGKIAAPTLIVWGSDDEVIPPSYADRFARVIKGSEVRLIKRMGHVPTGAGEDELNRVLLNFLSTAHDS